MSVIGIHGGPLPGEPCVVPEVVELLEHLLGEAKDGNIISFCIAGTTPTGIITTWTEGGNLVDVVAAITLLYHRVIRQALSRDDNEP